MEKQKCSKPPTSLQWDVMRNIRDWWDEIGFIIEYFMEKKPLILDIAGDHGDTLLPRLYTTVFEHGVHP